MKRNFYALWVLLAFYCPNFLTAQINLTNDFVILNYSNVTDTSSYITALNVANWDNYRLQNKRYQLSFDNGFLIELKSAVELVNLGNDLNISTYKTDYPAGYISPVLTLFPGNIIGMLAKCNLPSKYIKN